MSSRRGPLAKMLGGGIGLAKEFNANRKARRESAQGDGGDDLGEAGHSEDAENPDAVPGGVDDEHDDEEWMQDLDQAQQDVGRQDASDDSSNVDSIIAKFIKTHPPPSYSPQMANGVLSMPIIIPQRRPESRTRGFVRAYAPVLSDAEIDQATWLEFLDGFQKSINQNGWFQAANVAVGVASKVRLAVQGVSIIAKIVVMVIHVALEGGRRGYVHYKQNKYLDAMNEQFFMPRGLYCLIIKYKPSGKQLLENVDVNENITEQISKRDGQSQWKSVMSSAAGTTTHEEEIPEFAPLVFPGLDSLDDAQKESSIKHFGHFLQDYFDRQAQAKFDAAHPESKLAGAAPRKEFASAYSDPTSDVSSGNIVSVLSGGKVNPKGPLAKAQDHRNARRQKLGIGAKPSPRDARQQRQSKRPMNKMLKQDALYLLVVNMPTQEEMDRVMNQLKQDPETMESLSDAQ